MLLFQTRASNWMEVSFTLEPLLTPVPVPSNHLCQQDTRNAEDNYPWSHSCCRRLQICSFCYGDLVGVQAKNFIRELERQSSQLSLPTLPNAKFRDYVQRVLSISLLNGNCFVQHIGCLRLREWDGKYRRDRRRMASVRHFTYRPLAAPSNPPPPSKEPIPENQNIIVNLTLIPDDVRSPEPSSSDPAED